jgi:hypothetical protein
MAKIKTIGILTSGGDAPGMNAAIRAVVRTALNKGLKVKGIQKGYNGLLNDEIIDMDKRSVADIIQRGGTVLYTARCMEFMTEEGQKRGAEVCRKHNFLAGVQYETNEALNGFGAASGDYDFTQLDDFGDTLNQNIHDWFSDENNLILWHELQKELIFEGSSLEKKSIGKICA